MLVSGYGYSVQYSGRDKREMVSIKWAGKCVSRAVKATGHAVWLSFQEYGYIMAAGYLPQDDTSGLVNPVVEEFQRNHSS